MNQETKNLLAAIAILLVTLLAAAWILGDGRFG
jgi:hypothetical protein